MQSGKALADMFGRSLAIDMPASDTISSECVQLQDNTILCTVYTCS